MSYGKPTTLIARTGYGGVGDELYVGPRGTLYQPTGGVLDKIGDFLKGAGTGALNYYNQSQQTKGQADLLAQQAAAQQGGMPSWILPAALVGGGVLLVMMMRRGPRANPARGRRSRRRRTHRRRRHR